MDRTKFDVLDALRGLAALFVVIRHSGEFFGGNPFYSSFLAVDIFFLLSGFVIAHAYDKKLSSQEINCREFILIRLIRFYPAYILSIALCALAAFLGRGESFGNFILTLFFIPNFLQSINGAAALFPINTVFWSLFYEIGVNIYYAITRNLNTKRMLAVLTALSALAIFAFAFKDGSIDSGFTWGVGSIALGGARAFFGIFFGIYLYKIRSHRALSFLNRFAVIGPITLMALVLAMPKLPTFGWLFQAASVLVVFPICVLWASKANPGNSAKYLSSLGLMSYPLYVLHVPITELINHFFGEIIRMTAPSSGILLVLLLSALCLAVERYYERPAIRYLRHRIGAVATSRQPEVA